MMTWGRAWALAALVSLILVCFVYAAFFTAGCFLAILLSLVWAWLDELD